MFILPICLVHLSSFAGREERGRQSFSYGRRVSHPLFQCQCHLVSQQDTLNALWDTGGLYAPQAWTCSGPVPKEFGQAPPISGQGPSYSSVEPPTVFILPSRTFVYTVKKPSLIFHLALMLTTTTTKVFSQKRNFWFPGHVLKMKVTN